MLHVHEMAASLIYRRYAHDSKYPYVSYSRLQSIRPILVPALGDNDVLGRKLSQEISDAGGLYIEQFTQLRRRGPGMISQIGNNLLFLCGGFYQHLFISIFYQLFFRTAETEQIAGNYPKYVMTRGDMIQKRNGIRHINLPEFIQTQERFT